MNKKDTYISAIIVAAGSSERMGRDKILMDLSGIAVIERTLRAFLSSKLSDEIIVVSREENIPDIREIADNYPNKKIKIVKGGAFRAESVYFGVCACHEKTNLVLIHDGARPLVSEKTISAVIEKTLLIGAAAPVSPVFDLIRSYKGEEAISLERDKLKCFQTPQGFLYEKFARLLNKAYEDKIELGDDCELYYRAGETVGLVDGNRENIKLTTEDDVEFAEKLLGDADKLKIGFGYDVHAYKDKRDLILGGVKIPFKMGLQGHSDADVLSHSIIDALLGAAALGDIGELFPDSDDGYLGADSLELLRKTVCILSEKDWEIFNIDSTIVAQEPNLSDYKLKMRENIAGACLISINDVSVKATTEEKMGFTGNLDGVKAYASVLIKKRYKQG